MKQSTAIVLSGGGALGALQAGALRALIEAGIKPDLLVGTSIGAVNAACMAVYGFNLEGITRLEKTWKVPKWGRQVRAYISCSSRTTDAGYVILTL